MPDRARIGLRDALAAALAIHATPFNDGLTNADKHRPGFDNTTLIASRKGQVLWFHFIYVVGRVS